MKDSIETTEQVIKPVAYILIYVAVLLLLVNFMSRAVSEDRGEIYQEQQEIKIDQNNTT